MDVFFCCCFTQNAKSLLSTCDSDVDLVWVRDEAKFLSQPPFALVRLFFYLGKRTGTDCGDYHITPLAPCAHNTNVSDLSPVCNIQKFGINLKTLKNITKQSGQSIIT